MGRTSAAVKNRYANKNYDRINLLVPKGQKDLIREHAEAQGEKVNGYINRLIAADMAREREGQKGQS